MVICLCLIVCCVVDCLVWVFCCFVCCCLYYICWLVYGFLGCGLGVCLNLLVMNVILWITLLVLRIGDNWLRGQLVFGECCVVCCLVFVWYFTCWMEWFVCADFDLDDNFGLLCWWCCVCLNLWVVGWWVWICLLLTDMCNLGAGLLIYFI